MSKDNKPKFSLERRIALYLTICQDPTLDRTALHVAAVLLLKHTNSKSAKTVPGRDRIAEGMGRSEWTASQGLKALKARWLRQVRRVGTSASYEWNWEEVSAEEWQGITPTMNVRHVPNKECVARTQYSNVGTSPHIHIEEPVSFNQEVKPGSSTFREEDPSGFSRQEESKNVDGTPDTVIPGVEPTDNDINSNPPDTSPAMHGRDHDNTRAADHGDNDPLAADFEHFWAVYPRREKKEEARRAFVVAVEAGISPQTLIDKTGEFARSVAGKETRYIAFPATWLRDKRWTDDYDTVTNPDNPYAEEDAKYPPCPPGMRADTWRGICRVHGNKPGFTTDFMGDNKLKQLN